VDIPLDLTPITQARIFVAGLTTFWGAVSVTASAVWFGHSVLAGVGVVVAFVAAGVVMLAGANRDDLPATPRTFYAACRQARWPALPLTILAFGLLAADMVAICAAALTAGR